MLRKLFLLSLILSCHLAYTQDSASVVPSEETEVVIKHEYQPNAGDIGIGFNLSGIIKDVMIASPTNVRGNEMLLVKHCLGEGLFLRGGIGFYMNNYNNYSADSSGLQIMEKDSTYKNAGFSFYPGVEKHFTASKRLDPYIGANLLISVAGKHKINTTETTKATLQTDSSSVNTSEEIETAVERPGGFGLGVGLLTGFNYFIAKRLSLGMEYHLGYQYVSEGGEQTAVTTETSSSGTSNTTSSLNSDVEVVSEFQMQSAGQITLTYFFKVGQK